MSDLGRIALTLVAVGLLGTIVAQYRVRGIVQLLSNLAILPQWKFFGPNPPLHDVHIVARDLHEGGRLGPWQRIWAPRPYHWRHALWNPERTADAAIDSWCDTVRDTFSGEPLASAPDSVGYIAILRYCLTQPRPAGALHRQFAIVHTLGRGDRSLDLTFLSRFHPW